MSVGVIGAKQDSLVCTRNEEVISKKVIVALNQAAMVSRTRLSLSMKNSPKLFLSELYRGHHARMYWYPVVAVDVLFSTAAEGCEHYLMPSSDCRNISTRV